MLAKATPGLGSCTRTLQHVLCAMPCGKEQTPGAFIAQRVKTAFKLVLAGPVSATSPILGVYQALFSLFSCNMCQYQCSSTCATCRACLAGTTGATGRSTLATTRRLGPCARMPRPFQRGGGPRDCLGTSAYGRWPLPSACHHQRGSRYFLYLIEAQVRHQLEARNWQPVALERD